MTTRSTRRDFLAACTGGAIGLGTSSLLGGCAGQPAPGTATGLLDIHTHLFGRGDNGSGCYLSENILSGKTYRWLKFYMQLRDGSIDRDYRRRLVADVRGAAIDRAVLLAQDGVYDGNGELDLPRTDFYVPNDYLLETCEEHPDLFVPCVSVNPDRRDAIAELDRCHARGARVLKIHPYTQGCDIADSKHRAFFRRCADLDVLVMVHTGHEHSATVFDIGLADPRRLQQALEQGCRVVACHCGSGRPTDSPDFLPAFMAMAHQHQNLWGDTSVMCGGRGRDLMRLKEQVDLAGRIVHGSDYPFPSNPLEFEEQIGRQEVLQLAAEKNMIQRDLVLKQRLGFTATVTQANALVLG